MPAQIELVRTALYVISTGPLVQVDHKSFDRARSIGNVLSEFGGVFTLFRVLPRADLDILGRYVDGWLGTFMSARLVLAPGVSTIILLQLRTTIARVPGVPAAAEPLISSQVSPLLVCLEPSRAA